MNTGITLNNVSFAYNDQQTILHDISLHIAKNAFLGIIGTNGSGKSTLAYILSGLIPGAIRGKLQGKICIDGIATNSKEFANGIHPTVGVVFQNPDFSLFNLTVKEEIAFGLQNFNLANIDDRIIQALTLVGMQNYSDREPQSLSLGEKQKICIASVLALDTQYIILDEPVAMLDYKSSLDIYNILTTLNKQGKTIIVIEHDTDYLWQFAKEVLILNRGAIAMHDTKMASFTNKELFTNLGIKFPNTSIKICDHTLQN